VTIQFARSSGAGGQNVNKVNTKVDMRFKLDEADWLEDDIREALRRMVGAIHVVVAVTERARLHCAFTDCLLPWLPGCRRKGG